MKRVTGIGGIFIKARDPDALRAWYRDHLGLDVSEWGGVAFRWNADNPAAVGTTIWRDLPLRGGPMTSRESSTLAHTSSPCEVPIR